MAILRGDQFTLRVLLVDGTTYAVVSDLNSMSISSERDVSSFPVFNRATPHRVKGPRDKSFEVAGYFSPGDPGQDRLRAIEAAGDSNATVEVLWDGTNGYRQEVTVSSFSFDADPEGLQEYGFSLVPTGALPVVIGAGPIL